MMLSCFPCRQLEREKMLEARAKERETQEKLKRLAYLEEDRRRERREAAEKAERRRRGLRKCDLL